MNAHRQTLNRLFLAALSLGLIALPISSATGATMFTEDFSDFSPGPNLNDSGPIHHHGGFGGTDSITYGTGAAVWDSSELYRRYLRTEGTDYATTDFVLDATVTVNANAWGAAFLGIGGGDPDPGAYGEPILADSITAGLFNFNNSLSLRDHNTAARIDTALPNVVSANGTHRLRMTWDAAMQQAFYEVDLNYAGGPFAADRSIAVAGSDNGLDATNSRLYVGGGNGLIVDDISVQSYAPAAMGPSNVAAFKPVVYTSSEHAVGAVGQRVTDQVSVGGAEVFNNGYWLSIDGAVDPYFIVDLQASVGVAGVRLFGTHNAQHLDRGTIEFEVYGANALDGTGQDLDAATQMISSAMTIVRDPIGGVTFDANRGLIPGQYRYLKFVSKSAVGAKAGLNEIEVMTTPTGGYDEAVLLSGPRAYWRLGETTGPTAADSAAATGVPQDGSQDGTYLGGPTLGVPGAIDGDADTAVLFDGVDDQIQIADPVHPTAYTLEAWVKPGAIQGQNIIVRSNGNPATAWTHQLRMTVDGHFEAYTYAGGVASVEGTTVAQPDQWYHVVGTAENGGQMRLFVNGVEEGTAATLAGGLWASGTEWVIGAPTGDGSENGPIGFWQGAIDEVALYPQALLPATIAEHYAVGVPEPGGLVLGGLAAFGLVLASRRRRRDIG